MFGIRIMENDKSAHFLSALLDLAHLRSLIGSHNPPTARRQLLSPHFTERRQRLKGQ